MKVILIALLNGYQLFISQPLHQLLGIQSACRYPQSCSSYAKEMIKRKGVVKGLALAAKRYLSCQPFGTIAIGK